MDVFFKAYIDQSKTLDLFPIILGESSAKMRGSFPERGANDENLGVFFAGASRAKPEALHAGLKNAGWAGRVQPRR